MTRLVSLDCETTGLDPRREQVWEIATIDLDSGDERVWTIQPDPQVVHDMHPKAAEVNRYHERTSAEDWKWTVPNTADGGMTTLSHLHSLRDVLYVIGNVLEGAHIVGAVPDFDTRFISALFEFVLLEPPRWHHHLIDVENLAVGYLANRRAHLVSLGGPEDLRQANAIEAAITPPYDSDEIARWCGVSTPSDSRHTALGDARWAARWYQRIMEGKA